MYCTCDRTGIYGCHACQESESAHWMPEYRQPEIDHYSWECEMQQLELNMKIGVMTPTSYYSVESEIPF